MGIQMFLGTALSILSNMLWSPVVTTSCLQRSFMVLKETYWVFFASKSHEMNVYLMRCMVDKKPQKSSAVNMFSVAVVDDSLWTWELCLAAEEDTSLSLWLFPDCQDESKCWNRAADILSFVSICTNSEHVHVYCSVSQDSCVCLSLTMVQFHHLSTLWLHCAAF